MTTKTTAPETLARRRADLLAALASHDHGDGCLGIIVDEALAEDPTVTLAAVREIVLQAEADAAAERDEAPEARPTYYAVVPAPGHYTSMQQVRAIKRYPTLDEAERAVAHRPARRVIEIADGDSEGPWYGHWLDRLPTATR